MNDEAILSALLTLPRPRTAVRVAEVLNEVTGGGLTQSSMIFYFKQAFPLIPLQTLIDAGGWARVSGGGLRDEEFNALLSPWSE